MSDFYPKLTRRAKYLGTPKVYGYRKYREEISEDCQYRCVYCDMHQVDVGGEPTMELDHFRPESKFTYLVEEPTNLVYACRSCNRLKWHDWPAGESESCFCGEEGYLQPFDDDRSQYFQLGQNGEIVATQPPAAYVQRRLGLNRPLLKRLRLRAQLVVEARQQLTLLTRDVEARLAAQPDSPEADLLKRCVDAMRIQLELLDFFSV